MKLFGHNIYEQFNTLFFLIVGSILEGVGFLVFLVPAEIAPGGISGAAVIIDAYIPISIGIITLLANLPIQYLALRMLGGSKVVTLTLMSVFIFALSLETLPAVLNVPDGVSDDGLLNAIFGGIVVGIGVGMIHRVGGTAGGTATLGRILQNKFGVPLSTAYLYTDTLVILAASLTFGWEAGMLAMISLFVGGAATDYVLEGPSLIRTVTIITESPENVSKMILSDFGRGVTAWEATGMYTKRQKHVLYISVTRAQVNTLVSAIHLADPFAYIVVGHGHRAYNYRKPVTNGHKTS